jgi:hypothetical protein
MISEIPLHRFSLLGEERGGKVRQKEDGAELPRVNFGSSAFFHDNLEDCIRSIR